MVDRIAAREQDDKYRDSPSVHCPGLVPRLPPSCPSESSRCAQAVVFFTGATDLVVPSAVCKCAGDSDWSQKVRGCLACEHDVGTDVTAAHARCYVAAGPNMPARTLLGCAHDCYEKKP